MRLFHFCFPPVFLLFFCAAQTLSAQAVAGHVLDESEEPLPGAIVLWEGESKGVLTDAEGYFELPKPTGNSQALVASLSGYLSDTLPAKPEDHIDFRLSRIVKLDDVTITGKSEGTFISSMEAAHTEIITSRELTKAACCDLAGCFETQATVQAVTTNVLTSSKELRVMGLSGYYNQVLVEGFPLVQGLSYTYGVSVFPGPLIDKIFVAKGANSVLQGSEGITAQLNVIFAKPAAASKLLLNMYGNSFGETQYNAQVAMPVGEKQKWHTLVFTHIAQPGSKWDRDKDRFLDVTLVKRYSVFNLWQYRSEDSLGLSVKAGGMMVDESRTGGQVMYNPRTDMGSDSIYGQNVQYRQPAAFTKLTYLVNENVRLAFFGMGLLHDQDSWFGMAHYDATQSSVWTNAQAELRYAEKHVLRTGATFRFFQIEENISFSPADTVRDYAGRYLRLDRMPGVFAENTVNLMDNKLTFITGIRADHHQRFGWLVSPRAVVKWEASKTTTLRGSAGFGYRNANVFSENINLLASMRNVVFTETLQPEQALNIGASLVQKFNTENVKGSIAIDYYNTRFYNQVFPDYDSDPQAALLSNFTGKAGSHSLQTEVNGTFFGRFSAKVAWNFLNVTREMHHGTYVLPFNPRHRVMTSLSYMPLTERWHLDVNAHWFGVQQLASTELNPIEFQTPAQSQPYTQINAQFTWSFTHLDLYGGCENIFDFRQLKPITAWQTPFSPYFDTANVWGPTRGREMYVGLRYQL